MIAVRIDENSRVKRFRIVLPPDSHQKTGINPPQANIVEPIASEVDRDPIPNSVLNAVLCGGFVSTAQTYTRGRSFWTADSSHPILLRGADGNNMKDQMVIVGGEFSSLAVIPFPISDRKKGVIFLGSRRRDYFSREYIQLYETAAETLGVAMAHQRTQWELKERVKELTCLYGIGDVAGRAGTSLGQFSREIIELIPPGWQYPEITTARITLDNSHYVTSNFREGPYKLRAEIFADNRQRGVIEVFYVKAHPEADEGPFLKEERRLIDNIAEIIGRQVERYDAQWALRERVKELTCLYSIANVASRPGISQGEFLGEIVNLLPSGWQYPEITQAKITLDNRSFMTPGHIDTPYRQSAEIIINDQARGMVEINYAKPMPPAAEGPFLNEERNLINEIARQVGLIIEHWETEKEAVLLQEQLRHAERLATVGQLSAGVAHELNEPLLAIMGFAQLINDTQNLSSQVSRDSQKIVNAALHAREIIRKLMIFTRQLPVRKAKCDLGELIRGGLYFIESRCAREGIVIVHQLEENLPLIDADPSQLHQVLVNLTVNAIQAMPHGGKLIIKTYSDEKNVYMVVEDNGVGMTPDIIKQLFIPFFTTKEVGQGTGLGLAVVHGIVSSHGGSVKVKSEPGKGSSFEVCLPINSVQNSGEA